MIIYKYILGFTSSNKLKMPKGSKVLSVQNQRNSLTLWALVDTSVAETEERYFQVHVTGGTVSDKPMDFIGTVQLENGSFVCHVFEEKQ